MNDNQSCEIKIKNITFPNYSDIINASSESECQILIDFFSDEKTKTSIPKNSQKHIIKEEKVEFKNDTIKIDSLNSSKGILHIFVSINGKKVKSDNENEPNFYKIVLKDIEIKDEFQDLCFKIIKNIEIDLSIKVKNIIGGGFASRMNMFNKKSNNNNEDSRVISTGVNMKDRVKLFNYKEAPKPKPEQQNKFEPKKIKVPNELTNKLMNNVGKDINNSNTDNDKIIKNNKNTNKNESIISKDISEKEKNVENNIINNEKKNEEIQDKEINNPKNEEKEIKEENNVKKKDIEENKKVEQNNDQEKENIKEDLKGNTEEYENFLKENNKEEEHQEKIEEKNMDENKEKSEKEKSIEKIYEPLSQENIEKDKDNVEEKEFKNQNEENQIEEQEIKEEGIKNEILEEKQTEEKKDVNKEENKENILETLKIENELEKKHIINNPIKDSKKNDEEKENKKENYLNNKRASMQIPKGGFKNIISNIENQKLESSIKTDKNAPKKFDSQKMNFMKLMNEKMKGPPKKESEISKKKDEDKNIQAQENEEKSNIITSSAYTPSLKVDKISNPNSTQNSEYENNSNKIALSMCKSGAVNYEEEMKILKEKDDIKKRKKTEISSNIRNSEQINSLKDFGFEVFYGNKKDSDNLIEGFLDSINYEKYLSNLKKQGKKEEEREAFCEGFFIASFPKDDGKVIENSKGIPASCGHDECSGLYSMKPEIVMRYPLKDTKNLELNNLAATICFPTGIKLCYSENDPPKNIEDYVTQITNQKGERYYMRTFHFYHRMKGNEFGKQYKNHPIKHQLTKTTAKYSLFSEEDLDKYVGEVQKSLEFCESYGFRDNVYIPYCVCLISKYPYIKELENCLNSIFMIMKQEPDKMAFKINELIMYLIHSIPIPDKNMRVRFYIPYNNEHMELLCPKEDDISTMNSNLTGLLDYLSIDNIILTFRLLLSEKKILFIDNDYTCLTNITDSFISLLYPFKWVHTYIPIMSDQMLKYLQTFLPFLNGIHETLMKSVENIFSDSELETDDGDEVFLIYIKKNEINLSSSLKNEKKVKFNKYVQNNVLPLPFEKDLKKELNNIKSLYEPFKKKSITIHEKVTLENKMRDTFINVFVKMFYDYEKYIGILDDDVIFNKILFMNSVKKDEKFYNEFIDSQLFQQFTQNILKDEYRYFNKKIKEKKEKEEKEKKKKDKKEEKVKYTKNSKNKKDSIYLTRPDYLGIKENDEDIIKILIKEKYEKKKGVILEMQNKILVKVYQIEEKNYVNSDCIIYLTPEKKESEKEDIEKEKKMIIEKLKEKTFSGKIIRTKTFAGILSGGELTEKQIDQIKDDIKDIVVKIFKSQINGTDLKALKTEAFRNLETSIGRAFFVSLISNNNNNVISLQENSFNFLESLFQGIFNSILKLEETEEIIEQIVRLIKSSKYFQVQSQKKEKFQIRHQHQQQQNKTIYENIKKYLQKYNKVNQKNVWEKWYELDLKKKSEEEQLDDNAKVEIILNLCQEMIDLKISKTNIKNYIDNISSSEFGKESEIFTNTQKKYKLLISKAPYISST